MKTPEERAVDALSRLVSEHACGEYLYRAAAAAIREAVAEEREACAAIVEQYDTPEYVVRYGSAIMLRTAAAIRARGTR